MQQVRPSLVFLVLPRKQAPLTWSEVQRRTIDAMELLAIDDQQVAQMAAASAAVHLNVCSRSGVCTNSVLCYRPVDVGEYRVAFRMLEERPAFIKDHFPATIIGCQAAALTMVKAFTGFVPQWASFRQFGGHFSQYLVLVLGQHFAPLRVGARNLIGEIFVDWSAGGGLNSSPG